MREFICDRCDEPTDQIHMTNGHGEMCLECLVEKGIKAVDPDAERTDLIERGV